ncbi:MAG TPA: sortase [Candidatus Saccharimonadales bacterium]|nr:sortase [Candidatus Saccharimonadales bacterium]
MSHDPLFPGTEDERDEPSKTSAIALIRSKVARAYGMEPNAAEELAEAQAARTPSKHQRFMQELSSSGKSLAEIQTAWHKYYTTLSDKEKHEVWQEFYEANQHTPYQKLFQKQQPVHSRYQPAPEALLQPATQPQGVVVADHTPVQPYTPRKSVGDRTASRALKGKIAKKISANGKLTAKHHLQSLGFGLASGFVVLVLFLFTFFNEYIIAPFIQPSRNVSSTPIILSDNTVAADAPPSVTVPKINIQIPLNFNVSSFDETEVENGLKSGVVHYPSTVLPGQNGNGAYFGHSSGNIFNNGKYKFAFTLLHDITTGDLFYITYSGKTYAYRVFAREIVPPSDVGVILDTKGKQATATLITCDPPGISTNRLVLWGEQISPDPAGNSAAPASTGATGPGSLAGNGPTLWSQFVDKLEFWN